MRRPGILLLLVLATLSPARSAVGQSDLEPSVIFFELYLRSQPTNKTSEYVKAVQQDIVRHRKYSILARKDAAKRIEGIMVTPAAVVTEERLRAIEQLVQRGDKLIYTARVQEAIKLLHEAKTQLSEIVQNITLNAKVRQDYFTTQMLLVRSYMENGNDQKARQIMTEIVRQFEDEYPVTTDNYHPKVVDLYKDVFRSLKDQRTAAVTVTTNPAGCRVYINGREMKQRTPFTYKGLYPGTMHMQVRKDDLQSMVRKIDVGESATGTLDVDLEYESALSFSEGRFGLTFSSPESMKTNGMNYAIKLGKFLDVDFVVLAGVREVEGTTALSAFQYDVDQRKLVRAKDFEVKANVVSNRRISEMSAFLADVKVDAVHEVVYKPWYTNWVGWTLGGAALVSGGIGIAFVVKRAGHAERAADSSWGSYTERLDQAEMGNSAAVNAGIFAGIAGAAAVGSALVFALVKFRDDDATERVRATSSDLPEPPPLALTPLWLPGGGGMGATFSF